MATPVVHFEIIAADGKKARESFTEICLGGHLTPIILCSTVRQTPEPEKRRSEGEFQGHIPKRRTPTLPSTLWCQT